MTVAALLDALKPGLETMFGDSCTVSVADDEWTLLQLLGNAPTGLRLIILAEGHLPYGDAPRGLAGDLIGRAVIQIRRGMARDELTPAKNLLNAEEKVRRALLAIVFQNTGDEDWPADWISAGNSPHNEIGRFRLVGSGPYRPPQPDLALEHPAREVRWALPFSFRLPNAVQRINVTNPTTV